MIIMSFGSGLNMESKDPVYIKQVAAGVAYAHSKNISIGGYNLMSSSRTVRRSFYLSPPYTPPPIPLHPHPASDPYLLPLAP